jgi:uncharacterized membrane protein YuzA (DUF378 family)
LIASWRFKFCRKQGISGLLIILPFRTRQREQQQQHTHVGLINLLLYAKISQKKKKERKKERKEEGIKKKKN